MSKKSDRQSATIGQNETAIILESISDGVFTIDKDWKITSFNRAAEEITGVPRGEAIGRHCWEVFRSNNCEHDCALRQTMDDGKSTINSSTYIITSEKKRIPISISTSLLKSDKGEILGGVETFRDMSLVEELRKELDGRFQMGDMVSRSPSMRTILDILPQVAESDSAVLIQGETGTGKELLARAIHDSSPRRKKPFIAINCGALPDTLLESELFGHVAGAFTNAIKEKPGLFAAAKGGSLLLDEIGDTSAAFQIKLLRVLEEKEFIPLGSVTSVKSDVRLLAATNKDLVELIREGKFRQDLYYRINVVKLTLPPLSDRKEDIPLLIERFIDRMNRVRDRSVKQIDEGALRLLMSYDFPGNIRELENIIERAFILCQDDIIQSWHLPSSLSSNATIPENSGPLGAVRQTSEAQLILDTLKRHNYNRLSAARELGIHKSTLFRKIKKLGLSLPDIDGRNKRS